ncbi:uncharacterized protein ACA1_364260 [Acanthamoeba castellanii str. Neff]|uniref:Uncharacterized protein n=1 Tax=Acanthamoeba castellanii (strain ATCC 30010 / Neff) TaxID=1257118 RepID=L8GLE8_ACACF|nr:uncharacterized protein ACA1_364260 [Acanthamoeba castellanii str. Neff]ELR13900.1 hypothetical protein ACA1_364260 [Acanthamoeba castellanii str. Neff]
MLVVRLMLLFAVVAWTTSSGASSLALRDSAASASSCQPSGPATVVDIDTRLAVGATSLDIGTTNVDLLSPRTVVEFDPPFDPPAKMLSASCSCGDILGLRCDATWLFNAAALAESLVGHNITARLGLTNGTYLTTWTRVATVMPAPVLVASNTTQVPQYTTTFTVDGHYLGLPTINTRSSGGDQDLHLFFKDVNGNNVEAQVVQVSDDATSATVTFTAGGPQALGPLWACVELWGALTDYVQVATVVEARPDATSNLVCYSTDAGATSASIEAGSKLPCTIFIQDNGHPVQGSLNDFSIFLGPGSHGLLGSASMSPNRYRIFFTYTAPASRGFEQLHVTFNLSTEISGAPFNITIWEDKSGSGGDAVPWHIIIPVVASVGGVLVIAGVVAWALWLRRRRRCHYETINGYH